MTTERRPGEILPPIPAQAPGEKKPEHILVDKHAVDTMFKSPNQIQRELPFPGTLQNFRKEYGIELSERNQVKDYGIMGLTEIEHKVMEGILKEFSSTDYKGHVQPKTTDDIRVEKYKYKLPQVAYKNIKSIPVIQLSQRKLLELSGIKDTRGPWEKAIKALESLGSKQFCLYYERLAFKNGIPERDKSGKLKMETVDGVVDTLFTIKPIKDTETDQFKYYEIYPSFIFLDQVEKYFIKIPWGLRKELEALVGTKQTKYLYVFITWLIKIFEDKRRGNANRKKLHKPQLPYELKESWDTIAETLRMPETVYKRNKAKAISILDKCYSAAKALGYLKYYKREGLYDYLVLNEEKYYRPGKLLQEGEGAL